MTRLRRPLHAGRVVLLVLGCVLAAARVAGAGGTDTERACDQPPGSRFFWVERAFCDLEVLGPERARGLVIWNHGIQGTIESWKAPAPPVLRLFQARGWDVIMIKRHHLAETMPGGPLTRTVSRTLDEVAAARKAGYRKIALAGQSFGGYVTMEAAETAADIDAAIAFSPGLRGSGASGALDPTIIERILSRVRVGRLALVFPRNDTLFGSIARGERARPILEKRDLPWLMVDETAGDVVGHGGGVTGRFALRYGSCLHEFVSAAAVASGRFACQPNADDANAVHDLLVHPRPLPAFLSDPQDAPAEFRSLLGPHWTLVGDTLVLIGFVREHGKIRLVYRTAPSGGFYDATVSDGAIRAVLANKSTVVVSPVGDGAVTWTSADQTVTLKGTLFRLETR